MAMLFAQFYTKATPELATKFASKLSSSELVTLTEHLAAMDISLDQFSVQYQSALCTVHQAKGFECEHVALHPELHLQEGYDADDAEEVNIRYVAFSRHMHSLTLLSPPSRRRKRASTSA